VAERETPELRRSCDLDPQAAVIEVRTRFGINATRRSLSSL
jgi:hypothetical protein